MGGGGGKKNHMYHDVGAKNMCVCVWAIKLYGICMNEKRQDVFRNLNGFLVVVEKCV